MGKEALSTFTGGNQTNSTGNTVNGIATHRDTVGTAAHNIGRGLSKAASKGVSKVVEHVTGPSKAEKSASRGRSINTQSLHNGLSNPKLKDAKAIAEFVNERLGALLASFEGNPEAIAEAKIQCYDALVKKCGADAAKLDRIIAEVPELQPIDKLHKTNNEKDPFKKAYERARTFHEKLAKLDPQDPRLQGDWDQFDPMMFDHVVKLRSKLRDYLAEVKLSGVATTLVAEAKNNLARFEVLPTVEDLAKEGIQIPPAPLMGVESIEAEETFKKARGFSREKRTAVIHELASKGYISASWDLSQGLIRGDGEMFDVPHDEAKARYMLKQAAKQALTKQEKEHAAFRIARAPQPGWLSSLRVAYMDYVTLPRQRFFAGFSAGFFESPPKKDLADALKSTMQDFLKDADSTDKAVVEETQKLQKDMTNISQAWELFHHLLMRVNADLFQQQGMPAAEKLSFANFYEKQKPRMDKRLNMFEALLKFLEARIELVAEGIGQRRMAINMGRNSLKEIRDFYGVVAEAAAKAGYQPPRERARQEL